MLNALGCPFCRRADTLRRHSLLYGNDPACANGRIVRGQRVFCSPRGRVGGCGRTFPVFLEEVLPRHSVTAALLWSLLALLLAGGSIKAAVEKLRAPFALETFYRLLGRLRGQLDALRTLLCRRMPPPRSAQCLPLLQSVEHLQALFADSPCPVAALQHSFQTALMGWGESVARSGGAANLARTPIPLR